PDTTNSDLLDGTRVTYKNVAPELFNSNAVNVKVCTTIIPICGGPGSIENNGAEDTSTDHIYVGSSSGLSEGEPVIYQSSDPTNLLGGRVGGLSDGVVYYVHFDTAWTVQLATTYCRAVS